MNNPIEFIKMIKNPKQFVSNYIQNNTNPMLKNLVEMANKNDTKGLENFARNMFAERGQNFDEIMSLFK